MATPSCATRDSGDTVLLANLRPAFELRADPSPAMKALNAHFRATCADTQLMDIVNYN